MFQILSAQIHIKHLGKCTLNALLKLKDRPCWAGVYVFLVSFFFF